MEFSQPISVEYKMVHGFNLAVFRTYLIGINFRGDRIDHILRVVIFADLPNQDISWVLIFADCRRKFPFFAFPKAKKI